MTQAFNLAQFANNLNSSGQAAAGTSLSGAVPLANGGTNLTTVPTNGQLLIGNGTGYAQAALSAGSNITITNGAGTISIAATAAAPSTADVMNAVAGQTYNGVGTVAMFGCSNTSLIYPNQTQAGTKLFYISSLGSSVVSTIYAAYLNASGNRLNATATFTASWPNAGANNNTYTSVGAGTWRNIGHMPITAYYDSCGGYTLLQLGLFLRVS